MASEELSGAFGGALSGFAAGGPAGALVGGIGGLLGGSSAKKARRRAERASAAAAAAQEKLFRPFRTVGTAALDELAAIYGLPSPSLGAKKDELAALDKQIALEQRRADMETARARRGRVSNIAGRVSAPLPSTSSTLESLAARRAALVSEIDAAGQTTRKQFDPTTIPGYLESLAAGEEAIRREAAAQGSIGGGTLASLFKFGQQQSGAAFDRYVRDLQSLAQFGTTGLGQQSQAIGAQGSLAQAIPLAEHSAFKGDLGAIAEVAGKYGPKLFGGENAEQYGERMRQSVENLYGRQGG